MFLISSALVCSWSPNLHSFKTYWGRITRNIYNRKKAGLCMMEVMPLRYEEMSVLIIEKGLYQHPSFCGCSSAIHMASHAFWLEWGQILCSDYYLNFPTVNLVGPTKWMDGQVFGNLLKSALFVRLFPAIGSMTIKLAISFGMSILFF